MTPIVVYDCMVFLQALISEKGPAFRCFQLVEQNQVSLALSEEVLEEIQAVLNRFDLQRKFPVLVPERIQSFLTRVTARSTLIQHVPTVFSLPRDAKDEPYVNLAIASDARYLVSWNRRHMGYLMDRDTSEGRDFCGRFPHLHIVEPPVFLHEIDKQYPQTRT